MGREGLHLQKDRPPSALEDDVQDCCLWRQGHFLDSPPPTLHGRKAWSEDGRDIPGAPQQCHAPESLRWHVPQVREAREGQQESLLRGVLPRILPKV